MDKTKYDSWQVIYNLNQIIKNSNISENISNTGNSTIDCLINFKYAVAMEYGSTFQIKIFIPEELSLDPCDIGIALGNALDNAIEAVRDCRQLQKVIEISMGVKKQALVMLIKNPYEHVLKNDRSGKVNCRERSRNNCRRTKACFIGNRSDV